MSGGAVVVTMMMMSDDDNDMMILVVIMIDKVHGLERLADWLTDQLTLSLSVSLCLNDDDIIQAHTSMYSFVKFTLKSQGIAGLFAVSKLGN